MAGNEVLSQSEIDSLLDAVSSGQVEADELKEEDNEDNVEIYDFKHPSKLSRDQLRTLRMVYEGFGRLFSTALSTQLRTMVDTEVTSIEQLSYDEFTRSLPQPTIMAICDFYPLHGEFIIEMNPKIAYTIIERLFGGPGGSIDKVREFTDIEEVVLKKINKILLDSFSEAWDNVIELKPRLQELESNPQFTQIVPNNDMVILSSLECAIGDVEGLVNICIPYIVLEPIVSKLSAQYWFSTTRQEATGENIKDMKNRLSKVNLPVVAELGTAEITVGELLDLSVGDVIRLDKKAKEDIDVFVNGNHKFKGKVGKSASNIAIEISSMVEEDDWEEELEGDE